MKTFEEEAMNGVDSSRSFSSEELSEVSVESEHGSKTGLVVTVVSLVLSIFFFMLVSADFVVGDMLGVDITIPLFRAGVVATVISFAYAIFNKEVENKHLVKSTRLGLVSMLPAAVILIAAWTLVEVIGLLGTGDYLAEFIVASNVSIALLPAILFIIGGFVAFMTGTSWGTFGLLLPITGTIVVAANPAVMLVSMAAVLSGAILGDHCSPISDTTVLSATGAQSTLDAHFTSQLPYALISGAIALVGYVVYGLVSSLIAAYVVMAVLLAAFVFFLRK
jgi:Na+/H+ antiporter NhaC